MTFSSKISHFEVSKAQQEKHEVFCCYSLEGKLKHEFLSALFLLLESVCLFSISWRKKSKREKGDFQHFFLLGTAIIEVTDICVLNIRQPLFPRSLKPKLTANEFQVPWSKGKTRLRRVREQCFTVGFLSFNCVTTVPKFCDYFKILHFKSQDIQESCWGIKFSSYKRFRSRLNRRKR